METQSIIALVETLDDREIQMEAARVIASHDSTSKFIMKFRANADSKQWYKNAITWYVQEYGDLPSCSGPGAEIELLYDY